MRGGDGTLENAVSPSKNSLATATFRLCKSDKFGYIFSSKAEDILISLKNVHVTARKHSGPTALK